MRYDLLRDELVVCPEGRFTGIVLEREKVGDARLHGVRIIPHSREYGDIPQGNYLLLLHDGLFPVLKKYTVRSREEIRGNRVRMIYGVKAQYFVRIGNLCRPVSGKGSILRLFPQNKASLKRYAKESRLNFRSRRESSILSLITYAASIR